jgi:Ca2+-binding EF-hand superfamily protein
MSAVERLNDEQRNEIREAFALCDEDESGTIDALELSIACHALGVSMTSEEREAAVKRFDDAHKGAISFGNFVELMAGLMLQRDPERELRDAFALFDVDAKGYVTENDLIRIAKELGDPHAAATASMMFNEFAERGSARISFDQFVSIVTSDQAGASINGNGGVNAALEKSPQTPEARVLRRKK